MKAAGYIPTQGLWLVTRGAQPVTGGVTASGMAQAPLWGFGRVVALEQPDLWGGLVDLGLSAAPVESAATLLAEVKRPDGEDQVALRDGDRYVPRLDVGHPASAGAGGVPPRFRAEGTYPITGGLGYLGREVASWLTDGGARHLTLLGRRPLPDRAMWDSLAPHTEDRARASAVQALERRGVTVRVVAVDVGDAAVLAELFVGFGRNEPPLCGILHAAFPFSTALLQELSLAGMRAMLRTKAAGAWHFHRLSRDLDLDCFELFSSTTALWGVAGMAHYAAANTFLDALAHHRRALDLPALSVNWGLWDPSLALAAAADQVETGARFGLRPMAPDRALSALGRLLEWDATQKVVAGVDWAVLKPAYEARRPRPFFERVGPRPQVAPGPATAVADLRSRLDQAAAEERRELLCAHVQDQVARVLGRDPTEPIDRCRGFFEMGMDSLTVVQLRCRLEADVQRPLPATMAYNYPTVKALADYLAQELLDPDGRDTPGPAPPTIAVTNGTADDPDESSEDELLQQLAARLGGLR
jgi:myxalamid-type polyketide synthase MxaE and MxaD